MRLIATEKLKEVFEALKIDNEDDNVKEEYEVGNIGTAGRIIKMWSGADTKDDRELMSGRFHKPVRLAKFPNEISEDYDNPIIKEVDLTAVCSHHFAPFSTKFSDSSKVVIAYIPDKYVLGISKLQRVVRYIAQRGWLQEDLTRAIYKEISISAQTKDVYVKLKNIKHSCEFLRGALSESEGFTTEYFGGKFRTNKELLDFVRGY
jgi:GTP cyclohydrolase I